MRQRQFTDLDRTLRDLAATVPGVRHMVALSADGLRTARHGDERDSGERLAAAASGIRSPARSVARELPGADEDPRLVPLAPGNGCFSLMSAGERSCPAVTAGRTADPGMVSRGMRDLVARVREHLSSGPRTPERTGR